MPIPGNKILDLLISMALIYALLSLLVSVLLEWWNHFTKARAVQLKANIHQLLNDSLNLQYGELFYNHFLIDGLRNKEGNRPPQYIPSSLFAEVLIDIIGNRARHDLPVQLVGRSTDQGKQYKIGENATTQSILEQFKNGINQLNPSPLRDTLQSFLLKSEGDTEKLKKMLATWFDDYMDRASGWYKTKQRNKLLFFGFLVAITLNVDSLHLVKMISLDDNLRNSLVQTADQITNEYNILSDSTKKETLKLEQMVIKNFPEQKLRNNKKELLIKPLQDFISKQPKDSATASKLKPLLDLINSDTAAKAITNEYRHRTERILNVVTSLDVPIGWDMASAPSSWLCNSDASDSNPSQMKIGSQNQIVEYLAKRNQRDGWNIFKYILGILISGFSLSFGAPFWFDALAKLVNIRRAGKKPEASNVK